MLFAVAAAFASPLLAPPAPPPAAEAPATAQFAVARCSDERAELLATWTPEAGWRPPSDLAAAARDLAAATWYLDRQTLPRAAFAAPVVERSEGNDCSAAEELVLGACGRHQEGALLATAPLEWAPLPVTEVRRPLVSWSPWDGEVPTVGLSLLDATGREIYRLPDPLGMTADAVSWTRGVPGGGHLGAIRAGTFASEDLVLVVLRPDGRLDDIAITLSTSGC